MLLNEFHEMETDYATFFEDPDGIRLEVTNFREERRRRFAHFENETGEIRN